jgi:hypothetical protein
MRSRISGRWAGTCATLAVLAAAGFEAAAGDAASPFPSNVRIEDDRAAAAVSKAVAGAAERLKKPACRALLRQFGDDHGRELRENLETIGHPSERYLATHVLFYEGYRLPTCRSRRAKKGVAVTQPGSRVVFVCTTRFTDLAQRNPAEAEAVVIHEMLHTLGLGENPPSSDAITQAVTEACPAVPPRRGADSLALDGKPGPE